MASSSTTSVDVATSNITSVEVATSISNITSSSSSGAFASSREFLTPGVGTGSMNEPVPSGIRAYDLFPGMVAPGVQSMSSPLGSSSFVSPGVGVR